MSTILDLSKENDMSIIFDMSIEDEMSTLLDISPQMICRQK